MGRSMRCSTGSSTLHASPPNAATDRSDGPVFVFSPCTQCDFLLKFTHRITQGTILVRERRGSSVVERRPEEPCVASSILALGTTRVWYSGIISPCHGEDRGSIPLTRSKEKDCRNDSLFLCTGNYRPQVTALKHAATRTNY